MALQMSEEQFTRLMTAFMGQLSAATTVNPTRKNLTETLTKRLESFKGQNFQDWKLRLEIRAGCQ